MFPSGKKKKGKKVATAQNLKIRPQSGEKRDGCSIMPEKGFAIGQDGTRCGDLIACAGRKKDGPIPERGKDIAPPLKAEEETTNRRRPGTPHGEKKDGYLFDRKKKGGWRPPK